MTNISRLGHSWDQLRNTVSHTYSRPKLFASHGRKGINHALPNVISQFLQSFNNGEKKGKVVRVEPKLQTTTTVTGAVTPITADRPILLSRIAPKIEGDEEKRTRIQARWRKLGPLLKSVQYSHNRRNWDRIILTKVDSNSLHLSNRIREIFKQQLRKQKQRQQAKQANAEKLYKRPRLDGILLSSAKTNSKLLNNEVNELPRDIVKPTATITTTVTTTTVPVTDYRTDITQQSVITVTTTPTTVTTNSISDTVFSSSSLSSNISATTDATSDFINFDNVTTVKPKSFSFSTSSDDYHFRKITPAKKFKFAQKFRRQPRLKVRKPDEKGALRGNQTASGRNPIVLPQLEPLNLENEFRETNDGSGFDSDSKLPTDESGLPEFSGGKFGGGKFGGGRAPPVDFSQPAVRIVDDSNKKQSINDHNNVPTKKIASEESLMKTTKRGSSTESTESQNYFGATPSIHSKPELKNSGLLPASPPSDFDGEFGTGKGPMMKTAFHGSQLETDNEIGESIFTGDSALVPNRAGPTGDGLGPPIPSGAAVPPPVPAVGIGGAAAGIIPTLSEHFIKTANPPTTIKPSALLSFLNKADIGFNQAINHFEQGTPIESAAIDILEVALGSEKLDSQAKLLGHIDRTIGIDNLQRLQRWVNTGGALDAIKEQLLKFAKNYSIPENLLPTVPPQLQYLFAPGKKR
ncbi:unnamed protein product [Litomosoides sigmodontis]|uniref:Uncharacterized protein n=1 Tax=Litomosoides sigmodontis TaxID=42156 RepID=A0A3P6TGF4_LITSI|nr:unnamed protein product [Litomosoides sigmodontis]